MILLIQKLNGTACRVYDVAELSKFILNIKGSQPGVQDIIPRVVTPHSQVYSVLCTLDIPDADMPDRSRVRKKSELSGNLD